MRLVPLIAAWLLVACAGDEDPVAPAPPTAPSTASTGDTGMVVTTPASPVVCRSANAFRLGCEVSGAPDEATLTLTLASDPEFIRTKPVSELLNFTSLVPNTLYAWALHLDGELLSEGTASTMAVPNHAQIAATVTGSLGVPYVGMLSPCGAEEVAVVLSETGELVWYEELSDHLPGLFEGVSFTEDNTVLGVAGFPSGLVEVDRDGSRLWVVEQPPLLMHHDVFRREGLTYVIVQESLPVALLDGFDVYDASGAVVWEWRLSDVLTPQPFAESGLIEPDYTHANSVWVDEAGDVYLSLRHLSSVMKIGGLGRPTPGEVVWTMVGDPDEQRLVGDMRLLGGESFVRQHNVHLMADGRMALLDNRNSFVEMSRLLWLDIDEDASTAEVSQAWSLPMYCPFQGGAWTTTTGLGLATCAPHQHGFAFAPGSDEPVWSMQASCAGTGGQRFVPRMVPLDAF